MGRLNSGVSASSSITMAAPRYSANQLIGAPSTGPTIKATAPRSAIAINAASDRRAAAQHHSGRNQTERPRGRDQHRLEHLAELGHAEVELDLEDRQADDDAAEAEVLDELQADAVLGRVVAHRPAPLVFEEQRGDRREPGAADHHQVGRPPQRDVLAEDAVPDVVERKAGQRVQAAAGHQHAADRRVPVAGDPHRERAGLLVRQHDRRAAGDEQQEQARPG